jgi:hypothetical protein
MEAACVADALFGTEKIVKTNCSASGTMDQAKYQLRQNAIAAIFLKASNHEEIIIF